MLRTLPDKGVCIFCGARARSKEDVIPLWLARIVKLPEGGRFRLERSYGGKAQPTHTYALPKWPIRDRICRHCNNRWMSRLQTAAKPIVGAMIAGIQGQMTPEMQDTAAAWLTMTAMVAEWAEEGDTAEARYFSQEERTEFMTRLIIPAQTRIYVAHLSGAAFFGLAQRLLPLPPSPKIDGFDGEVVTLCIGKAAFQLFVYRPPAEGGLWTLNDDLTLWRDALIQFGPNNRDSLTWPPQSALDDLGAQAFARRFRTV